MCRSFMILCCGSPITFHGPIKHEMVNLAESIRSLYHKEPSIYRTITTVT